MTKLETRLTVLYDEPFWIGLSERVENGKLTVAKHVFGAEPSMADIYEFVLNHSYEQKYSPPVDAEVRKEQNMSYNVSIKTIPERYAATVHMTIPHYEDEGMVWQILGEETAPLNMVPADPCLVTAEYLDDEYKEENVELIAWKTVKGKYPDSWGQKVIRFYDPDGNLIEGGTPV